MKRIYTEELKKKCISHKSLNFLYILFDEVKNIDYICIIKN